VYSPSPTSRSNLCAQPSASATDTHASVALLTRGSCTATEQTYSKMCTSTTHMQRQHATTHNQETMLAATLFFSLPSPPPSPARIWPRIAGLAPTLLLTKAAPQPQITGTTHCAAGACPSHGSSIDEASCTIAPLTALLSGLLSRRGSHQPSAFISFHQLSSAISHVWRRRSGAKKAACVSDAGWSALPLLADRAGCARHSSPHRAAPRPISTRHPLHSRTCLWWSCRIRFAWRQPSAPPHFHRPPSPPASCPPLA